MKTKRIISIILIGVLVAVWGTIIYRVVASVTPNDQVPDRVLKDDAPVQNRTVRYSYLNDVKDPFIVVVPALRKVGRDSLAARKKKEVVVIVPPPYKLNGILFNAKRKAAILESSDGSIYFLSEKDTLTGMMILKIEPKQVSYVYHSQKMFWQIE